MSFVHRLHHSQEAGGAGGSAAEGARLLRPLQHAQVGTHSFFQAILSMFLTFPSFFSIFLSFLLIFSPFILSCCDPVWFWNYISNSTDGLYSFRFMLLSHFFTFTLSLYHLHAFSLSHFGSFLLSSYLFPSPSVSLPHYLSL